jgi:carboxymethylenebutenolidase
MCHDVDTNPAVFAQPTTSAQGETLTLHAHDGAEFSVYQATPRDASGAGVVIFPDVRGLHPFYEQLACHLAEQGHIGLAIDYFGRTAGTAPREADFPFRDHINRVTRESVDADLTAAVNHLRQADGAVRAVFGIGFCFGGRQAFLAGRREFGLAGVIGFYGGPNGAPGPIQLADELASPTLGLFGGADEGIPSEDVRAFDEALARVGIEHELVTYPGAPHSFFDRRLTDYADAAADAWRRTLDFISAHTPSA